jgi:hypothetical protein
MKQEALDREWRRYARIGDGSVKRGAHRDKLQQNMALLADAVLRRTRPPIS